MSALLLPGGIPQYWMVFYLLCVVLCQWIVDRMRRVWCRESKGAGAACVFMRTDLVQQLLRKLEVVAKYLKDEVFRRQSQGQVFSSRKVMHRSAAMIF